MREQLTLFAAISERDRILASFAENHRTYLEFVRAIARDLARRDGSVTIDDVRLELEARDLPLPKAIGADERVFGALFNRSEFIAIAQRPTSRQAWAQRVGTARSAVTVYRLRVA